MILAYSFHVFSDSINSLQIFALASSFPVWIVLFIHMNHLDKENYRINLFKKQIAETKKKETLKKEHYELIKASQRYYNQTPGGEEAYESLTS